MLSHYLTASFLILYLKILNVTCHGNSSLVYVIDDTYSMHDDIRQVKIGSVQILNDILEAKSSEIANIVLVTFNDPDVRARTLKKDPIEFKEAVSKIHVYGGDDCPEYSMAGIIEGLEHSLPNSYMYVFTDASAKDYYRSKEVTDLCIKKQTQIIFLLTGHCGYPSSRQFKVYYEIAEKCSGQVFVLDKKDITQFLTSIRATINDPKSIVKTVTVPPKFFATPVRFTLDDKTDYAIVSTSGESVDLAVTRDRFGPKINTEHLMWTNSVKRLKLFNTVPGDYVAWVKGASDVSVAIYAKTDFTFEHGFSEIAPKSLADTSRRPIADKNQHLSIQVTDPDHGVNIERVNILSMKDKVWMSIPLKHVDGDFYITNKFVSPKSTFKIQVKGINKQTGTPIYRNSRTVIEPIEPIPEVVIPEKAPIVSISEGSQIAVKYDSSVVLRCRVSAFPKPTIMWQAEDGTVLKSNNDVVEPPNDFVSYLRLQNVTTSHNYVCKAKNKLGRKSTGIKVNVESPFEVIRNLPETTKVKYQKPATLYCDIKSDLPIKRVWFSEKAKELSRKGIHLNSNDDKLVINSMELDLEGKYGCKVWLKSYPDVFIEQHTILQIDDLSPPSIKANQNIIDKTFTASCLTMGTPTPTTTWYYGRDINGPFSDLKVKGEELKINNINQNNFGIYKCIAENAVGKREETFNLVVNEIPKIIGDKTKYTAAVGDSVLEIPCTVTGYPEPTIVWKKIDNKIVNSDSKHEVKKVLNGLHLFISNPSLKDTANFICEASNNLGTVTKTFDIVVTDTPKIIAEKTKYTAMVGDSVLEIPCKVTGYPEPTIVWKNKDNKIVNTDSKYEVKRILNGLHLYISNPTLKDTSNFICEASNNLGTVTKTFETIITDIPRIIADKTKYTGLVGDSVLEIPCIVTGNPEPTIVWKNIDNKIVNSDSKYQVKKVFNGLYLHISNPSLKDRSNFICEASNNLGTATKTFETIVADDFQNDKNFYGKIHTIYLLENVSKNITCDLPHFDSKSVRWYKVGLLTDVVGTYYPIKKASPSDDAIYTCRVNQEHGSSSETYKVIIGTKPTFDTEYDSSMMLWTGDDSEFVDCSIKSSKLLTKVEWSYNGKNTNIKEYKHPILGWGQYKCKVSNIFGSAEKSVNVTTDGCLIKRKVDMDNNPPLISSFNIEFESKQAMYAVNKYMFMELGQKMRISCHNTDDKNNFNIYPDEEYLIAECMGEDKFVIKDNVYKYSDIKCEKSVEVTVESTKTTCTHERSELIKVGFNIDSGGFIETYKVCFDNEVKVPIYAFTEISWSNLGNQVDYNKWISIPNYQGVKSTDCDNESKCCYGKEQLVNAVDVTFGPPQAATFYDYNSVGVWNPCRNHSRMSWQMIEENVRKLLGSYYNIKVWSGASEYEQQTIGMVPRYLWKVIASHGVIVYVNHPKPTTKDIKCSASIETLNTVINPKDQFTYLCGIDEFSNVFNTYERFN